MIDLQNAGSGLDGYRLLAAQLESLLADERDFIANAAQFSAFLYSQLEDLNWAGFYLNRDEELVLGPFQGQIACVRIPFGRGVCGAAAQSRETQRVQDVHEFPGHIACDSASNSELVVPLIKEGRLIGVLDLDSPSVGRFSEQDQQGIEELARIFLRATDCCWGHGRRADSVGPALAGKASSRLKPVPRDSCCATGSLQSVVDNFFLP